MIVCRSCGAEIEWAITPNGKRIPLDKLPVEDGNILVSMRTDLPPLAIAQTQKEIEVLRSQAVHTGQPHTLFKSHFATCPNANKHRKK
jgi:hypothetical protein